MSLKDIHKIREIILTHFDNFQLGTSPVFGDETIFLSETSNEIEQYIIKRGKYSKKNMKTDEELNNVDLLETRAEEIVNHFMHAGAIVGKKDYDYVLQVLKEDI